VRPAQVAAAIVKGLRSGAFLAPNPDIGLAMHATITSVRPQDPHPEPWTFLILSPGPDPEPWT
jgi:hypothetical protein